QLLLVIRREEKIIPKQTIADEINKKASTNKEHLNYFISLKAPLGDGAFLCINQHHSPFVTFSFTGFITAA
ncbi:hypothetical protein GFK09_21730, partial [Salmonella enterica subsp. enterica serovar Enteritidis]|nr:hypothetical protein [Salmonella enterica subsp. enterica serovar Enteritidis]